MYSEPASQSWPRGQDFPRKIHGGHRTNEKALGDTYLGACMVPQIIPIHVELAVIVHMDQLMRHVCSICFLLQKCPLHSRTVPNAGAYPPERVRSQGRQRMWSWGETATPVSLLMRSSMNVTAGPVGCIYVHGAMHHVNVRSASMY